MSDEELEHLVNEVEDYKQQMAQAEKQMESSSLTFLTVHAATMEVLDMVGKVQYNEQFSKKRSGNMRCMFCMMVLIVIRLGTDTSSVAMGQYLKLQ